MIVFALLGAAFADRLWGPPRAAPGPAYGIESQIVIMASVGDSHGRGIIDRSPGTDHGRMTTAKDL